VVLHQEQPSGDELGKEARKIVNSLIRHGESTNVEMKRSIDLVAAKPDSTEKSLVALANSPLDDQHAWLVFGIDNSRAVLGMVDLSGKNLDDDQIDKRKQQLSQIASQTKPAISFSFVEMSHDSKELLCVRIRTRRPGGFYQTKKGVPYFRIDDDTYFADGHKIREWISGEPPQPTIASRQLDSLFVYLLLALPSVLSIVFWAFSPGDLFLGAVIGAALAIVPVGTLEYFLPGEKVGQRIFAWCQRYSHRLISVLLFAEIGSLILNLLLTMYPALCGIHFSTYLEDLPRLLPLCIGFVFLGTLILHLPGSKLHEIGRLSSMVLSRLKADKKMLLSSFVIIVALSASLVPTDIFLAIATPRVSFIESREILEGTVYVEQVDSVTIQAYVLNEKHIHFVSPTMPVISNFDVRLASNSTKHPDLAMSSIGNVEILFDSGNRLAGLRVSTGTQVRPPSEIVIRYYSEIDPSRVLAVSGWREDLIDILPNGTRRYQRTLTLSNVCKYQVKIQTPFYIWSPSSRFEVRLEQQGSNIDRIYFTESKQTMYIPYVSIINPKGYVKITITYVQV